MFPMNVLLCTVEYSTSILNTIFYYSTGTVHFRSGRKGCRCQGHTPPLSDALLQPKELRRRR